MSARVIVEMDGERYEANDLTVSLTNNSGEWLCLSNRGGGIGSAYTKLPPIDCQDNSAVIGRLEAEKAELKRKVKLALEFTGWVGMNAEKELWQTIRDKACETEFKMNHPEGDDAEGGVK